ncbi:MAG TPA: cytochrome c biogenesis protein DipZ [Patescibacteria group bacterium]|nr:cytochrome c biogenesis protein DipZ [Patescibacteria group bacterium]
MILLIIFAFLAGIVTILSPCILPVLPIVLSGSIGGGKRRPTGIVVGFIASFTFFTLALSAIVKLLNIPPDALRIISIIIVAVFGVALLVPQVQKLTERLFGKLSSTVSSRPQKSGFWGGILLGLSLGLLWTPCVGPILASVIALAATNNVDLSSVFITLSYAIGTAIPMFLLLIAGRSLLNRVPWLISNSSTIQRFFGVVMILLAVGLYFNADRTFQNYILTTFPNYGSGLTALENIAPVEDALAKRKQQSTGTNAIAQLMKGLNMYPQAPELVPGGKWFNTKPLTMASLRGKVVLVDFWTYTCINCIRTLPYIESWYKKYVDKGLVIIGVHTPEFEFEKNADNVTKAISDFGITYPVMQDNDYATWNAYSNQYWPAKYFIDKDGKIRSTHFGEGNYDESEKMIQQLLAETGVNVANMPVHNTTYDINAQTPETYIGYNRLERFASPEVVTPDKEITYTTPSTIGQDYFALAGPWNVSGENATPKAGSFLTFRFAAGQLFLVMRTNNGQPGHFRIYLDGNVITADDAGDDVQNGIVTVVEDRLYRLIKLNNPGSHELKLEFLDGNMELYAFTFG